MSATASTGGRGTQSRPHHPDQAPRVMGEGKRVLQAKEREIARYVAYFPPGEGSRSLWVFGELVTHKTKSEQTSGAYSLFEVASQPGSGPLPHVQHREDESFYVLEGEYEFLIEDHILRLGTGTLVYISKSESEGFTV